MIPSIISLISLSKTCSYIAYELSVSYAYLGLTILEELYKLYHVLKNFDHEHFVKFKRSCFSHLVDLNWRKLQSSGILVHELILLKVAFIKEKESLSNINDHLVVGVPTKGGFICMRVLDFVP